MKKNIKLINPNKLEKPRFSIFENMETLNEENKFHRHPFKKIETRLYAAKQLVSFLNKSFFNLKKFTGKNS